jgi:hypothetical protein
MKARSFPAVTTAPGRLEVLGVVPHEGAHPLVGVDAQAAQRVRQPRGPAARFGVSTATGPILAACDNLATTEYRRSVAHDRRDRQRDVHHRAAHRASSLAA